MGLREGEFVRVRGSDLGTGKLSRLSEGEAEVTYFASPARGQVHTQTVDLASIEPVILSAQTRVYWYDSEAARWFVGRASEDGRLDGHHFGSSEDLYFIELPNQQVARVLISALHVRWDRPVDDPVAYLATRTTETPYWHEGRRRFLRQAVAQRAHAATVTGLWSAAVRLEAHQMRAVRTVLMDPVQRYLLADEVGLGKTIEAGAVLRQYILDEPEAHQALVVVPGHLVDQWEGELRTRFYLGPHLGETVHVVPLDDLPTATTALAEIGMLIIDEAHQAAALAFSDRPDARRQFELLVTLARRDSRVLLLSATPVLRNEAGFLAMLHLLEPGAYQLNDLEGFRQRVQNRQVIAEALTDLQPDAMGFFLEDALEKLSDLTSDDIQAGLLINRVRALVDEDEQSLDRVRAIGALREHVSEVYRLHRRLIRHRREFLQDILRGRAGDTPLNGADPTRERLAALLEQWREQANLAASNDGERSGYSAIYWSLLQASLSHPLVFAELTRARLERRRPSAEFCPAGAAIGTELSDQSLFADEPELLHSMLGVRGVSALHRAERVADEVRAASQRKKKLVVFVDAPGVADRLLEKLVGRLGDAIRRHRDASDLAAFVSVSSSVKALICDRASEEGLNLQSVPAEILHFDLPLSPARMEQRIGRVDRFGAKAVARSRTFSGGEPLAEAWRACVQDAIQVFDRSVASLQYVLEEQLEALRSSVFEKGREAFDELHERLVDPETGLEAELTRIRTQEQLDSLEESSAEDEWFETLDDFDAEDDMFRSDFDSWAVARLQFGVEPDPNARGVVRYRYGLGGRRRTLVSPEDFLRHCLSSVDDEAGYRSRKTHRLSFSRSQSVRKSLQLARVGHSFVDGLVRHARRDDRGVAYAMWRQRSEAELPLDPWLAFGFDFLIEGSVAELSSSEEVPVLRRRLDSVFPPRYETVWVDQELEPIEDPSLIALLSEPYADRAAAGGRDWNLSAPRWDQVRKHLHVAEWDDLCNDASRRAFQFVSFRVGIDDRVEGALKRLEERVERVRVQLEARIGRAASGLVASEQATLAEEDRVAELVRAGIRAPRVTPDSAFAIILSTSSPFGAQPR